MKSLLFHCPLKSLIFSLWNSVQVLTLCLFPQFEIGKGTLKLSGYVRGESLDVNQLVHLPGLGDYQMTQIDQLDDPFPLGVVGNKDRRGENNKVAGDAEMTEVG